MKRRLAPFLDLLDARYLPLLFVVAPQSYTVFAWLQASGAPAWVAAFGGFGYEVVYVGAVAWAEYGAGWSEARYPAITALLFSVAVAVAHYAPTQGALAVLHAGFPLVAYAYTRMMHARRPDTPPIHHDTPDVSQSVTVNVLSVSPDTPALSKTARIRQIASRMGKSESTVRRMVERGDLTLESENI